MLTALFDENKEVSNKLGNLLKEKLSDVAVYTDLLSFLNDFCEPDTFANTLFLISEDVLKKRNLKTEQVLKKFDFFGPILIYSFTDVFYLKLDIHYIYEYHVVNYKIFTDYIYKIEECFFQFINGNDNSSCCTFQCEEIPVYLSHNEKTQEIQKLYNGLNIQKKANMSLTRMQTKLFRLLLSEKEGISLENIACNIWGNDCKSKSQKIYTLIHSLKQTISEKIGNKYQIIYHNKKYRLLKIPETTTNTYSADCCCNASITGNLQGSSIIK